MQPARGGTGREGVRLLARAAGQAAAPLVVLLVLVELLRRERVVTASLFSARPALIVISVWLAATVYRAARESAGW